MLNLKTEKFEEQISGPVVVWFSKDWRRNHVDVIFRQNRKYLHFQIFLLELLMDEERRT